MSKRMIPFLTVAGILVSLSVIGLAAAIVADGLSESPDDLWAAIARAGITAALIPVVGAVATGSFRFVDGRRARDLERRRVLHDVVEAYNQVKAVRRRMRALALGNNRDDGLRVEEAAELRSLMVGLNDAQLRFEAIKREVDQSELFARKRDVLGPLTIVEDYINKSVLDRWEDHGYEIWAGAKFESISKLELRPFMKDGFKHRISQPLDALTGTLQDELFGRRRQ